MAKKTDTTMQQRLDEQRALILSVVGRVKVLPAAKRGRYATPEEIRARLVPLAGTS